MNRALWIVQGLLALFFALGSGAPKLLLPLETLPMPIPLPASREASCPSAPQSAVARTRTRRGCSPSSRTPRATAASTSRWDSPPMVWPRRPAKAGPSATTRSSGSEETRAGAAAHDRSGDTNGSAGVHNGDTGHDDAGATGDDDGNTPPHDSE